MQQEWVFVRTEKVCSSTTGHIGHLCWTEDKRPVCPVCGTIWPYGAEAPWTETGSVNDDGVPIVSPSYGICLNCRTEFGIDDVPSSDEESLNDSWAALRRLWLIGSVR